MSAALKVKEDQNANRLIRDSIAELLTSLEDGTLQATQVKPTDLNQLLISLREVWRGVVAVELIEHELTDHVLITHEFANSKDVSISQPTLQILDQLLNELTANAHRHGLATKVEISLAIVENNLVLRVIDNGIGPRQGLPGLGTALLNAATAGRWEIRLGPNQIGSVVLGEISL